MHGPLAIIALAAAPIMTLPQASSQTGVRVSVTATAEIIRAGTSAREQEPDAPRRHVRARPDGRSTVEFE
jgi:hypothetical protein